MVLLTRCSYFVVAAREIYIPAWSMFRNQVGLGSNFGFNKLSLKPNIVPFMA